MFGVMDSATNDTQGLRPIEYDQNELQTKDSTNDDKIKGRLKDALLQARADNVDSEDTFRDETIAVPEESLAEALDLGAKLGPSKWKTAYENTKHFAGGLVSHPFESTKHYSILRHSHGLVFYRGPLTNIAVTIFADQLLPADRTLWLQTKGWTGKAGLKVKTLTRASLNWIDVTPSETLDPHRSLPPDNRAWERDINKFLSKAPRQLRRHVPRETAVIRVPHEAEDGYFRLILCGHGTKKALCPSPVFRVASAGLSSAKFKGASLSTLPIEIGVKVMSTVTSNAALNLVSPVTQQVQDSMGQYMPGFWTQEAGTALYTTTGAESRIDNANERYQNAREAAFEKIEATDPGPLDIAPLGSDEGPEHPYPIEFSAKVVAGRGEDKNETGTPSANLQGVAEDVRVKLTGVYFGWASLSILSSEKSPVPDVLQDWKEAIVTVAPSIKATPTVAPNKEVRVFLIQELPEFVGARMKLMVLGYLHRFRPFDPEQSPSELYRDIAVAQLSLARSAWQADAVVELVQLAKKGRSLTDHYVQARQYGQKQVDKIPLHKLGVRTDSMGVRDQWIGNGGFSIPR